MRPIRIIRSKKFKVIGFIFIAAIVIGSVFYLGILNFTDQEVFSGKVMRTELVEQEEFGQSIQYQHLYVQLSDGPDKDNLVELDEVVENVNRDFWLETGDKILVSSFEDENGEAMYVLSDVDRRPVLYVMWALFVFLVVWVGRGKGLLSVVGLILTFFVIFAFIIPKLIEGSDPVKVSIVGVFFMLPAVLYLSHGFNKKSNIAAIGTAISVFLIVVLYEVFSVLGNISGFSSEETTYLPQLLGTNDLRGVLLAGIIIGAVGMLDDITVNQVSVVAELKEANPQYGFKNLWLGAMRVGRDHINAIINTLFLAYTGASFPLLILLYANNQPGAITLSGEGVMTEIMRAMLGSMGVVASVPITTFLASYIFSRSKKDKTK